MDDEPFIVEALRKALYQYRARWEVSTATSGADALAAFERSPWDAVICDARMPEIGGDEVLSQVSARWPSVVRVVLTGEVQHATLERLQRCAHHFFRKPVAASALFSTIEHSLDVTDRLAAPAARELLARLRSMPAVPATFDGINRLDRSPDPTLAQYVAVIEGDPAVCANVLRIVNSAWFGLSKSVTSVREAVRLLGLRPLRNLVLASEVYSGGETRIAAIRDRALARITAAPKLLALLDREALQDDFATASVLADVGEVVLLLGAPDELDAIPPLTGNGLARLEEERRRFGVDHALLGGVVLTRWGLPLALADAVSAHHQPATAFSSSDGLGPLVALTTRLQALAAQPEDPELRSETAALAALFGHDELQPLLAVFRPSSSPSPA